MDTKKMPHLTNDLEIIESCLSGNTEAFSFLVDKYKNLVYQLALRMTGNYHDSEDIAQEAFLKAYRSLPRYNSAYSFSSWLYKITLNIIRDRLRKKEVTIPFSTPEDGQREIENNFSPDHDALDELAINPEEWQIRKENNRDLQLAINALPLSQKEIIILRHIQNLSYHEIARVLNIPVNSVKARLHRARRQLKELLQEKNELR